MPLSSILMAVSVPGAWPSALAVVTENLEPNWVASEMSRSTEKVLAVVAAASTPSVVECCYPTTIDSGGKTFLEKKEALKVPRSEGVLQPNRVDLANEEMEFGSHNPRFFETRRIGCAKPVKAPFARNGNFDAS